MNAALSSSGEAAVASASTVLGPAHVFEAQVAQTRVRLRLPRRLPSLEANDVPGVLDVLEAAAALQQAEGWIRSIEDWLGLGLKLAPVPSSAETAHLPGSAALSMSHPVHRVQWQFPLSLLARSGPPPNDLTHWQWRPLACALVLDAVNLGQPLAEHAATEGALLVLPSSFSDSWQALIQPLRSPGICFKAEVLRSRSSLAVRATGNTCPPWQESDLLLLRRPLPAPIHLLLGWPHPSQAQSSSHWRTTSPSPELPLHASHEMIWRRPVRGHSNESSAAACTVGRGCLIPVGKGFAMRLSWVRQPADAQPPPDQPLSAQPLSASDEPRPPVPPALPT